MERLLEIRDGLNVAKHLIVGAYMAAQSPTISQNERMAICAIAHAAREKLELVDSALELLIAEERRR